ncbi:Long chain acyl-CoA synthetase 8 [Vitis vinifera]|uniref:Long chain acyl-CoA synthetase 8 n=1 Tax=Vitis vinifera TaxID=29760 RepID=A0A438JGV5_VITVI|nr:Long chain acyl-CoA synthetase 8 [Vitis vinifera]
MSWALQCATVDILNWLKFLGKEQQLLPLYSTSCGKHSRDPFLGTRKLINREFITAGDGRKFEKVHLGEYQWETYEEIFNRACNFASGLIKLGHNVDSHVAIFSDTQAEWLIAFQGCFRQNITIVTIYASLGEDALIHSLNETQISTLICDSKQLKKLASISSRLEMIKNVIYFDNAASDSGFSGDMSNWTVSTFSEVEKLGKENPVHPRLPSRLTLLLSCIQAAVPGVMMTHGNIVATAAAVMTVIPELGSKDIYLAYLPLAHVFELAAETVMMAAGCAIGYGSALTLTDTSNKIQKGTKGDASMLKPTLMATVPAILDRVRDGVLKQVEAKGGLVKKLFNIGYKRRLAAVEGSCFGAWGLERVFWDAICFQKDPLFTWGTHPIHALWWSSFIWRYTTVYQHLHGVMVLSSELAWAPIGQGYGLTETCAGATFTEPDDPNVGMLDRPFLVPISSLFLGKKVGIRHLTNQCPEERLMRGACAGFYTGDIGQFQPNGCLEIIDRKKDIVKLQHGRIYLPWERFVEAALMGSNYVDNIMVYADPLHNYCVALVVPSHQVLEKWAEAAGIKYKDFSELCNKEETVGEVQQSLSKVAKAAKLDKFEPLQRSSWWQSNGHPSLG